MDIQVERRRIQDIPVLECYDPEATQPLPMVLIMHGFSGCKEHLLVQAEQLAREGYYAVSIDLHLHGEAGDDPFVPARLAPRLLEVIERSAGHLATLAAAYRDNPRADAGRIGLLGVSLGGAVIYHYLPRRSPAVRVAVCLIAGAAPFWIRTMRSVQGLYPEFGVTDELLATWSAAYRPGPFLENVADFPLLLQYGAADPVVPLDEIRRLYQEVRQRYTGPDALQLIEYPGVGHETPPAMYLQAGQWFAKYLRTRAKSSATTPSV